MSKKKKPVSQEFNTMEAVQQAEAEAVTDLDRVQAKAGSVAVSISDEVKQKLDASERLEAENANYARQLSEMQDRMAGYLQEIADLKASAAAPAPSAESESLAAENSRLAAEVAALKAENAALKSQQQTSPQPRMPKLSPNCYRRPILDGYSSWN